MTEILTKKKAIELCLKMWRWLEVNPEKDKTDWLLNNGYIPGEVDCHCFICEYVGKSWGGDCSRCPLIFIWGGGHCMDVKSPYRKWSDCFCEVRDKIKYSKQIADYCESLLEELEDE